jgi:hypothetical protein
MKLHIYAASYRMEMRIAYWAAWDYYHAAGDIIMIFLYEWWQIG